MIDKTKIIEKVTVDGEEMRLRGVDVSDTTATPADVLAGKTFYGADEQKKEGTVSAYEGSIEVSPSDTAQTLPTLNKLVQSNITVLAMPKVGRIRSAELADVTFKLLNSSDTQIAEKTTDTTNGGEVEFSVSQAGTYKLYAYDSSSTLLWSKTDIVVALGETIVVPTQKDLNNYTDAQIHIACDNGYAHTMFEVGQIRTFSDTTSIFNNLKVFIEDIVTELGKDYIDWRLCSQAISSYDINPRIAYVISNSATSFAYDYFNFGGEKYSAMQRRMMSKGEAVFSQATGILPDDYSGSLKTGVKFSELVYTDTSLGACKIYSYNCQTDEMTQLNSPLLTAPSNTSMMFIEGYFESAGTISEETYNAGYYYTYNSSNYVYTRATAYSSGTTYYALYKAMHTDGVFVSALSSKKDYLVKRTLLASAGGTQTSKLSSFSAYANLPCIENMFGVNRDSILKSGSTARNANAYNLSGEGSKLKVYNDWSFLCTGNYYWTRSAYSSYTNMFCGVGSSGYAGDSNVYNISSARVGFRTC